MTKRVMRRQGPTAAGAPAPGPAAPVRAASPADAPWLRKESAEELLEHLARLVASHGAERLLTASLIEETPRCFPDPWQPTLVGVGRVLHRLLGYAGLEGWRLELVDARAPLVEDQRLAQPRIDFIAAEDDRLVFQVEEVGLPRYVPAALCFETARAFIAAREPQHPYRARGDEAASREARVHGAVATIYLGFGLITANAAHALVQEAELIGRMAVSWRARIMLGALPAGDLTFLLAVQLILRGLGLEAAAPQDQVAAAPRDRPTCAAPLLRALAREQAEDVREWLEVLGGHAAALRARLGVGEERPAPRALPELAPLPERAVAELEAAEERHRKPHSASRVVRYWERKTVSHLFVGLFLALLVMIPLAFTDALVVELALAPAGALAGALLGRRRRIYYCGGCWMLLRAAEASCPKCGAAMGEDAPLSARKAKLDEEEDPELVREALDAEHPDARHEDEE